MSLSGYPGYPTPTPTRPDPRALGSYSHASSLAYLNPAQNLLHQGVSALLLVFLPLGSRDRRTCIYEAGGEGCISRGKTPAQWQVIVASRTEYVIVVGMNTDLYLFIGQLGASSALFRRVRQIVMTRLLLVYPC